MKKPFKKQIERGERVGLDAAHVLMLGLKSGVGVAKAYPWSGTSGEKQETLPVAFYVLKFSSLQPQNTFSFLT